MPGAISMIGKQRDIETLATGYKTYMTLLVREPPLHRRASMQVSSGNSRVLIDYTVSYASILASASAFFQSLSLTVPQISQLCSFPSSNILCRTTYSVFSCALPASLVSRVFPAEFIFSRLCSDRIRTTACRMPVSGGLGNMAALWETMRLNVL